MPVILARNQKGSERRRFSRSSTFISQPAIPSWLIHHCVSVIERFGSEERRCRNASVRFIFSAPARLATFSFLSLSLSIYASLDSSLLWLDAEAGAEADLNRAAVIEREKASEPMMRTTPTTTIILVNVMSRRRIIQRESAPKLKLCIDRRVVALNEC